MGNLIKAHGYSLAGGTATTPVDPGGGGGTTDPGGGGTTGSVVTDGLIHYWKLDEASGDRVDSVGNSSFEPAYAAAIDVGPGVVSNAAVFNNQNKLQNHSVSTFNTDTSISIWASFDANDSIQGDYVLTRISAGSSGEQFSISRTLNTFTFSLSNTNNSSGRLAIDHNLSIVTDKFYNLVVTFNSSTGQVLFYVDATQVGTFNMLNPSQPPSLPLIIGGFENDEVDRFMRGKVDECGIWNRVLTPAEISSIYNDGNGTTFS